MTRSDVWKTAINYWGTLAILISVVITGMLCYNKQQEAGMKLQHKETTMEQKHQQVLKPFKKRINGIFADMEATFKMIDDNADTPDATVDGYTVQESMALQLVEYRKAFDAVLNDMNQAVVDYARQARIQTIMLSNY